MSKATICPKCRGGKTKEKSYVEYDNRDGSTVGVCFRASCGNRVVNTASPEERAAYYSSEYWKRVDGSDYRPDVPSGPTVHRDIHNKEVPFIPTSKKHPVTGAYDSIGVPLDVYKEAGWRLIDREGVRSFYIPLTNATSGQSCGYVLRRVHGEYYHGPKALSYCTESPTPLVTVDHYSVKDGDVYLLVEDAHSALRASVVTGGRVRGVALLGTNINWRQTDQITTLLDRGKSVVLALDADATSVAVRYKRAAFPQDDRFQLRRLLYDVKDMTEEDIKELVGLPPV